jgi:hypothetical protein
MNCRARTIWLLPLLTALLAGCATTPKINWPARVGNYTYDQAGTEFGPPDKTAKLSDGATVAEWQERPEQIVIAPEPYFFVPPGNYFGPFPPMYAENRFPAVYLRLTFAPDGRLEQFKEVSR